MSCCPINPVSPLFKPFFRGTGTGTTHRTTFRVVPLHFYEVVRLSRGCPGGCPGGCPVIILPQILSFRCIFRSLLPTICHPEFHPETPGIYIVLDCNVCSNRTWVIATLLFPPFYIGINVFFFASCGICSPFRYRTKASARDSDPRPV